MLCNVGVALRQAAAAADVAEAERDALKAEQAAVAEGESVIK